jgi:hypothetical protein
MGGASFSTFRFQGNNLPCSAQLINTQLSSPNPEVLELLKAGDELKIQLVQPSLMILALYEDEIAGVIINKEVLKIINCMINGWTFKAKVRSVIGGRCAILISSVKYSENDKAK